MPELYPYQREDAQRMATLLEQHPRRVFNFSEQRTGKLVEFIELCRVLHEHGELTDESHVLIVAPLSTLWNVTAEFKRWLGWHVDVNAGERHARLVEYVGQPRIDAVNKEKLRNKDHWLFKADWDLVLLDEAHHFRGRQSAQHQGAKRLSRRAKRLVIATGTPSINGLPRDVWPLLHLADPKTYSSFWRFMEDSASPVLSGFSPYMDEASPWKPGALEGIKKEIAPLVLRRTYDEVRGDLPNLVPVSLPFSLEAVDPTHFKQYKELEKNWLATIEDQTIEVPTKLALTTRLRQMAASPLLLYDRETIDEYQEERIWQLRGGKVKTLLDYMENLEGQLVVFCWHRRMAALLIESIERQLDREARAITGTVPLDLRQVHVRDFRDGKYPVLVATIPTLREGITLDNASAVLFAEQSWVPADNDQAARRILGPAQQGSPLAVTLWSTDTVEAILQRVLARKDEVNSEAVAFQALLKELAHA